MYKIVALDIETTGLDPWRDQIYMCGLLDLDTLKYTCVRTREQLRALLLTIYKDYDFVGHRTDFDIKFLQVHEWLTEELLEGRTIHDSRILASLVKLRVPAAFLNSYEEMRKEANKALPKGQTHRKGSPLSLKVVAPWYLKVPPFWETPGDHNNEEYNEKDCLYTAGLFKLLSKKLQDEGSWDFYLKLLEWSKMLREMEIRGISISMDELDKIEKEYLEKRNRLKIKLDEQWKDAHDEYLHKQILELQDKYMAMSDAQIAKGRDKNKTILRYRGLLDKAVNQLDQKINYSSPPQMSWLLKDYLGLDITDPEGDESTGKAVLNKLAADGFEDIKTYLEWREADKVLTMYLPTYKELQVDGVIHPSFNLTGTRTGRTSSSGPNLQQVPSKLYRLFRPRDGYKFVQYDLSGIEAALIALYSGDKRLFEILDKGESIHDHNAKALFGLECSIGEVAKSYPKERKAAKTIGFACFYGAGWRRIKLAFSAAGFPISDKQAKEMLQQLKNYYPEAFEFHKEITEVFEKGETVFNLLGRPVTLQPHENPYMQGFNSLIQSSASDLNLEACYRAHTKWNSPEMLGGFVDSNNSFYQKPTAYPLLVIHDCVMAEANANNADFHAMQLEQFMTDFNLKSEHGLIKLKVEGGVSHEWAK